MKRKLTKQEVETIGLALELMKEADSDSIVEAIRNEDGEDSRIESILTLNGVVAKYIDEVISGINDETDFALIKADMARNQHIEEGDPHPNLREYEVNKWYNIALHGLATAYYVDSQQGYEIQLANHHVDKAVKFANPNNDLYTLEDYEKAKLAVIQYFDEQGVN